jgi:hypothetical protein
LRGSLGIGELSSLPGSEAAAGQGAELPRATQPRLHVTRFSPDDTDSGDAVIEAGDLTMFMRLYVPSTTDGPWKSIVANSKPELIRAPSERPSGLQRLELRARGRVRQTLRGWRSR